LHPTERVSPNHPIEIVFVRKEQRCLC